MSPGFTVPSGSMLSQRSQMVVAPRSIVESQEGEVRDSSSAYAASSCPVRDSASVITGVPANPVPIVSPPSRTS